MEQTATTAKHFAKQPIFNNAKVRGGKKVNTRTKRWYKDVGLGFKTPAEAINGTYIGQSTCSHQAVV